MTTPKVLQKKKTQAGYLTVILFQPHVKMVQREQNNVAPVGATLFTGLYSTWHRPARHVSSGCTARCIGSDNVMRGIGQRSVQTVLP